MADVSTWYKSVPRFTRFWLSATVGLSILARFGILPMQYLYLDNTKVFSNFQIWRLVTALFYYPLSAQTGFHFMLNCYFLYNYSLRLERDHFQTNPADYLVLLLFNAVVCVISGIIFKLFVLMDPLVLSVLYVWCQLNKEQIVNFWFGTKFKAMYLPWVLLLVNLVMSGGFDSLLGIVIGHLYVFLKFQYPQEIGGQSFLNTPNFLKSYFPDVRVRGFGEPPASRQPNRPSASANTGWGRGSTLGSN